MPRLSMPGDPVFRKRPKRGVLDDKAYLIWLRDQPCVFTGQRATENELVVAAHVGTAGKGLKTDDHAIPVLDSIHKEMHRGEITALKKWMPDWLVREAMRAWAEREYRRWKAGR